MLRDEIRDPEDYERVVAKLVELARETRREVWANRHAPPKPPRRKKKRTRFEFQPDDPRAIEQREYAEKQAAAKSGDIPPRSP
jgi:hypothetical protein